MGKLDGKVAIVVGTAPRGMGAAAARLMAQEGAKVVLANRTVESAEQVAGEIRGAGGDAFAVRMDLASEADIARMVAAAVDRYGGVDILDNSGSSVVDLDVGVPDHSGTVIQVDKVVWDRIMDVNLFGFVLTMKHVIPEMLKRGGGSIINISSGATLAAEPVVGAYSISKAGVEMLTKHIATAYGRQGIRCNAILPGVIRTGHMPDEVESVLRRHILLPRVGQPEDIAHAVAFLASDEAAFITGQLLTVDGGMYAHTVSYADVMEGKFNLG